MSLSYFTVLNGGIDELWISDGTATGTHLVTSLGGTASRLMTIGARAYLSVDDIHGTELWTSDGTAAGTGMVKDIFPGPNPSKPNDFTNVNGTLYFAANDGVHGIELWKSDGTAAGTVMVADINPTAGVGSGPQTLTNVNGTLFFSANDGVHGQELWKSDGTAAGTVMVADSVPGPGGSAPFHLLNVNGTLFFDANDGINGRELWKSDGTAAGTGMVKDIFPGPGPSVPDWLTDVNGKLFFQATDPTNGTELWTSDGTAAGTMIVRDIDPGPGSGNPFGLVNVNGTLFFSADDGTNGRELWKSDGTAAGTMMVKDINPGGSSLPAGLTNVNGTVFFAATGATGGNELWKSDGTAAGTVMVADIVPGPGDSSPEQLTNVNGVLEFYAFDGTTEGLFRSDGTAAGTVELAKNVDFTVPIGSSPPLSSNGIFWRDSNGTLAAWNMNGGTIAASAFLTSNGAVVAPDASWNVAGISDFNGDRGLDVLWRNTDGTLADWTMNGAVITSSATLNQGGVAVKPDASWSVAGVGDFDGDTRSDILWRNTSGEVAVWQMNGSTITGSGDVTSGGVAVRPDASWSVAGIGDFNSDNRRDVLWRNSSGELTIWTMDGTAITSSGDIASNGTAVSPDASWSVAGIGDFNHDGFSDILWRNANGSLAIWLMDRTNITSSSTITSGGTAVTPDASWHIVEIGDFNGDSNSDILWRNDNGTMAEWLMNGSTIVQSVTPDSNGVPVTPGATWSTQAKPTIG